MLMYFSRIGSIQNIVVKTEAGKSTSAITSIIITKASRLFTVIIKTMGKTTNNSTFIRTRSKLTGAFPRASITEFFRTPFKERSYVINMG